MDRYKLPEVHESIYLSKLSKEERSAVWNNQTFRSRDVFEMEMEAARDRVALWGRYNGYKKYRGRPVKFVPDNAPFVIHSKVNSEMNKLSTVVGKTVRDLEDEEFRNYIAENKKHHFVQYWPKSQLAAKHEDFVTKKSVIQIDNLPRRPPGDPTRESLHMLSDMHLHTRPLSSSQMDKLLPLAPLT